MRCDHQMGLPSAAIDFLKEYEVPVTYCNDCKRPFPRELEVIGHYFGMMGVKYLLHRHQLIDGEYADEYLQCDAWSSGPHFFLGLEVLGGVFEWDQDAIDNI